MNKNYDNTNKGALFANKRREKQTQPNATGTVNIEGVEYYVDAWTNTSEAGQKYQSLKFKRKEQVAPAPTTPAFNPDEIDEDLPF
jgi:hypothetical protein